MDTTYDGDADGLSDADLDRLFRSLGITPSDDERSPDPLDGLELLEVKPVQDLEPGDRILSDDADDPDLIEVRGTWTEGVDTTVNGMSVLTGKPAQARFFCSSTVNVYA